MASFNVGVAGGSVDFNLTPKPALRALRKFIKNGWTGSDAVAHEDKAENWFRDLYGDYKIIVQTNSETAIRIAKLSKEAVNEFELSAY